MFWRDSNNSGLRFDLSIPSTSTVVPTGWLSGVTSELSKSLKILGNVTQNITKNYN